VLVVLSVISKVIIHSNCSRIAAKSGPRRKLRLPGNSSVAPKKLRTSKIPNMGFLATSGLLALWLAGDGDDTLLGKFGTTSGHLRERRFR